MMSNFKLGRLVMTRGISDTIAENEVFKKEVMNCLGRYIRKDWGDMCDEDKQLNDMAVINDDERILAAYNTTEGKIYIITEHDRSYTTVVFSHEY